MATAVSTGVYYSFVPLADGTTTERNVQLMQATWPYLGSGLWGERLGGNASGPTGWLVRTLYSLQGRTIAQQESTPNAVYSSPGRVFLLGDHLGSVAVATSDDVRVLRRQGFPPEARCAPAGNITSKAGIAYAGYGLGGGTSGHAHAPASVGGQPYAYDADGNVTAGGGRGYTWDAENQPTAIGSETYGYDADNQRVVRAHDGTTTVYLGGLWEQDFATGPNGVAGARVKYALQGRVVAERAFSGAGQTPQLPLYLIADHLGSISTVIDSSGTFVSSQTYGPWGAARTGDLPQTTLDYTGQRKDGTGLLSYGARSYDPALGCFSARTALCMIWRSAVLPRRWQRGPVVLDAHPPTWDHPRWCGAWVGGRWLRWGRRERRRRQVSARRRRHQTRRKGISGGICS